MSYSGDFDSCSVSRLRDCLNFARKTSATSSEPSELFKALKEAKRN